jgi:hypothetical protein
VSFLSGKKLSGKITRLPVPSDRYTAPLLALEDRKGRMHFLEGFDSIERGTQPDTLRAGRTIGNEELDYKGLRTKLCSYHNSVKHLAGYKEWQEKAAALMARELSDNAKKRAGCTSIMPVSLVNSAFYFWRGKVRESRAEALANGEPGAKRSYLERHGTNIFFGQMYMAVAHCWATKLTGSPKAGFAASIGLGLGGNTWEEIDMDLPFPQKSLPIFNSAGNEVKTDMADFKAGMIGIAAHVGVLKLMEMRSARLPKGYQFSCD